MAKLEISNEGIGARRMFRPWDRRLWSIGAALGASALVITGCTSKGDDSCVAADIDWQTVSITSTNYLSGDATLGFGHYPEDPTASQGSACVQTYQPLTCQGEITHIINTYATYAADTHIDGSGNFRIASISFDNDMGLVSQFNSSGSGTEGETAHFNGDVAVPDFVSVVSEYPISTAPADPTEGDTQCSGHAMATFRLE